MTKHHQAPSPLSPKMLAELTSICGPGYVVKITKKKGRGRPKKIPVMQGALVLTLDKMMEEYTQRGLTERQARKNAFAEILANLATEDPDGYPLPEGTKRRLDMETLERYYRAGVRELRDGEMRLAAVIDRISASHGRKGPMPEYGDYRGPFADILCTDPNGMIWRRYRRGKRALSAARRKQEK
jgi:hypothetical protein